MSALPPKQTCSSSASMSAKCHKQTRVEAFIECSAAQFVNQKNAGWFIWMPIVIVACSPRRCGGSQPSNTLWVMGAASPPPCSCYLRVLLHIFSSILFFASARFVLLATHTKEACGGVAPSSSLQPSRPTLTRREKPRMVARPMTGEAVYFTGLLLALRRMGCAQVHKRKSEAEQTCSALNSWP
jgi:hypothetical protein